MGEGDPRMQSNMNFASAIGHVLSGLTTPVFLAGLGQGPRPTLTAYTGLRGKARQVRTELVAALLKAGLRKSLRVRVRHDRGLAEPSSLEALTKRFAHETIIYD